MCLITSQREPYIAPIDIPVVKVLKVNKSIEFSTVFSYVSAYIPRGTKFFISDDHQTIGAEELYILNHMAPRAFGLTDQQVYDIIALAIWNRKNQ